MSEFKFSTIEEAILDIKAGKMIIVVDDEDRENEGDFIMSAEKVTPAAVNFMAKFGRGLICVSITEDRAKELDLRAMVPENTAMLGTNFTVSVDHLPSNSTGISATDRSNTIFALIDEQTKPTDLGRPGHIFPLVAKKGGVLRRAGHTEAAVDLAKFAGAKPAGVLCEIMSEDGSMARVPELITLAEKHQLKLITIQDLIKYKRQKELFVELQNVVDMPTKFGNFKLHTFVNKHDSTEHHLALVKGEILANDDVLVRVHSECLTGDVFGSARCDCGQQLEAALSLIEKEGKGAVIYLRQEGRGIGFVHKMKAYELQEKGLDTVEANAKLGFKADLRDYGFGAQMIHLLGIKKIRLMTNNPTKLVGLKGYDLEIVERVQIEIKTNPKNKKYLETKRDKLGHEILKKEHR